MEKEPMIEHDWLLIGTHVATWNHTANRVYEFRCKWCNETEESFDWAGPPKKRNMIDECKRD